MSVQFSCKCEERKKPLAERKWVVTQRRSHSSSFSGGRRTRSDYSTVMCLSCEAVGRTKAQYVASLRDFKSSDLHRTEKRVLKADELDIVGSTDMGITCSKSGWLGVLYQEKPGDKIQHWCISCERFVTPGDGIHSLQKRDLPVFILGPKKKGAVT